MRTGRNKINGGLNGYGILDHWDMRTGRNAFGFGAGALEF